MSIITGKAFWAAVVSPNTRFEPQWQIDVSLDAVNKAKVKEDGLTIKNKGDERGDFVTIKRRCERRDGTPNQAPEVVDRAKRPMTGGVLIGNGSLVNVKYNTYATSYQGKAGTGADLVKVQVVDLVAYEAAEDFEDLSDMSDSSAEVVDDFDAIPVA